MFPVPNYAILESTQESMQFETGPRLQHQVYPWFEISYNQKPANVTCIHCKVAANVIRNFESCWTLDGALFLAPDDEESDRVEIFHIKEGRSAKSQHLALGMAQFMF